MPRSQPFGAGEAHCAGPSGTLLAGGRARDQVCVPGLGPVRRGLSEPALGCPTGSCGKQALRAVVSGPASHPRPGSSRLPHGVTGPQALHAARRSSPRGARVATGCPLRGGSEPWPCVGKVASRSPSGVTQSPHPHSQCSRLAVGRVRVSAHPRHRPAPRVVSSGAFSRVEDPGAEQGAGRPHRGRRDGRLSPWGRGGALSKVRTQTGEPRWEPRVRGRVLLAVLK